jgi:hypothetical protein
MFNRLDARERFDRKNDLIVSNLFISDISSTDLISVIVKICSSILNVGIRQDDIASKMILNRANRSNNDYTDLLVKFTEFKLKSKLMQSYFKNKNLNNSDAGLSQIMNRICFNDNLTPHNAEIYKSTKPSNIKSIFIYNGQVFIRKL